MRYKQAEKMEIIRMVEKSELPVKRTLAELDINRSTFYQWYRRYCTDGYDGLANRSSSPNKFWNKIPPPVRRQVVDIALEEPEKSPPNWPGILPIHRDITFLNPVFIVSRNLMT